MSKMIVILCLSIVFSLFIAASGTAYAATTPTVGTSIPQPTATQGTLTVTFTVTGTPPTNTPTTTLMPLPLITLIFPAQTPTEAPTTTPEPIPNTETPNPADNSDLRTLPPRIQLMLVLVVVLWVMLSAFAIIYIRQLR